MQDQSTVLIGNVQSIIAWKQLLYSTILYLLIVPSVSLLHRAISKGSIAGGERDVGPWQLGYGDRCDREIRFSIGYSYHATKVDGTTFAVNQKIPPVSEFVSQNWV